MMTPKQEAALRQALDCVSTLANARDWVGCTPNERWDEDEMYAELCNATICLKKSLSIIQEALAEQQSGIKQVIELYDSPEQPAQQDYWQEEARRYAQNAKFWRGKYEAATAQQQQPVEWGVDWGKAGDQSCVSIIKRLPGGGIEVLATEYGPPASKPWRGLTDDNIQQVRENCGITHHAIKTIEAKLRDKNA